MHRLATLAVALLAITASMDAPALSAAEKKPNIILILTDDVGLGNIHCYGGPFNTPNIDQLASGGTQFKYCYATPLCGPSRCLLLTGRYPFRTGHISNHSHKAVDPKTEIMIPTVMKSAGYVTASVGKWGQIQLGPGEWGFDEYLVFPGSGRFWSEQSPTYTVNGKKMELKEGEYLPDLMQKFVADFITQHKDKPFFLYYSMSHMHGPILRTPDSKKGADKDQLYVDNIEYMDKLVGQLVKVLDDEKLRENTVVIFTADNGTARFGELTATVDGKSISGKKASMLEGGSRVPLIVNWPGHTPAAKTNNDLTDFSDFFATVAELGGAKLPEGVTLDSRSFAPQIQGKQGTPREWVYVELNGKSYVRDGRFKLTNSGELFDLSDAPFTELAVASDSTDSNAVEARKALQSVLDTHQAPPGQRIDKQKKKQKKAQQRKRALRRAAAESAT